MFMHFPMHTFSTFQYTFYLNCFGAFLIVCFFPLSILFMLVVSRALKCKSTSAQNPLHSGASSSFDHAPLFLRFCNDDAYKAFTENFSRWGIHSEHRVILGHFADTDLPTNSGVLLQHARDWPFRTSFFLLVFEVFLFLLHRSLLQMCLGFLG